MRFQIHDSLSIAETRQNAIKWLHFVSLVVLVVLITGCAGKGWRGWEGRLTKTDNRVILDTGGPHSGIWQTNDLAIHYRYVREVDRLTINGQVKRQARIKHFHRLRAWVWVHFMDENGYIKESRRLWAQNGSDVYWQVRYSFNRDWQIPPDTSAMGFSYSGRASDRDVWWDFWRLP